MIPSRSHIRLLMLCVLMGITLLTVNLAQAQSSPSRVVAVGLVESIANGILTIEGIPFDISDAQVQTEAALQVGARVRVRFAVDRSGVLRVDRLQLASSTEDSPLLMAGTISSLENDRLQLGRISFYIGRAEIASAVKLGDVVVLEFEEDVEGLLVIRVNQIERLTDVGRANDTPVAETLSTTPPDLPFTVVDLDDARFDDVFTATGFNNDDDNDDDSDDSDDDNDD